MAKHGRLGVDYYALAFGILGIIALPIIFYAAKAYRIHPYKPLYDKIGEIDDWENSPIDIDDISK